MVTEASDQGTVYVVKAPGRDIADMQGPILMEISHELHQHDLAPVIRTTMRIHDQPDRPLALESFINVAEDDQWADFAQLSEQENLLFLFYDERLTHRLSKQVQNSDRDHLRNILNWADRVKASIPDEQYNFNQAKADFIAETRMSG